MLLGDRYKFTSDHYSNLQGCTNGNTQSNRTSLLSFSGNLSPINKYNLSTCKVKLWNLKVLLKC